MSAPGSAAARVVSGGPARVALATGGAALGAVVAWPVEIHPFWLLLIAGGVTTQDHLPLWVVVSCFLAIGLGTVFGGWRIVKTMGQRITKLKPVGGFAAEAGGAITLFLATHFGIPVSTTHTITGAIVGVGTAQRSSAVHWGVAGTIVIAWIVTIPASAAIAALAWWIGGAMR